MHRSTVHRLVITVAVVTLVAVPLVAQTSGSVSGRVTDESNAALPGATVTLGGSGLQGDSLTAITDAEGAYRFAPVAPGAYELKVELEGFSTQVDRDLRVGINQAVGRDFRLELSAIEEEIVVQSLAGQIETTRSELASRISPAAIENLPLNGRNFEDLVNLVPGVKPNPAGVSDQQFSIFGERAAATSFIVDGGDNNDPIDGGAFQRFTQDSIREFEVITTGYEAEFGRAQGGVVNVVTRSGTDDMKASAFFFQRNDSWDSSNVSGQDVPQLDRDQFGASLGGAIAKGKTYFFVSGEALDEKRGRNIDLSTVPDWIQEGLATPGGAENLDAGPQDDGLALLAKVDFLPNDSSRWSVSFNRTDDEAQGEIPSGIAGSLVMPSGARTQERDSTGVNLRHTWIANAGSYLETTAKFLDGSTGNNLDRQDRGETALHLFLSGFIQTGAPVGGRQKRDVERTQVAQSYSLIRGDHEIKVGYDFLATELTGFNEVWNDVEYSAAFLADLFPGPSQAEIMEDLFRRLGFQQSAARFFQLSANPDGSLDLDLANDDVGLFGQTKWRANPNLTVDLGLRYDRASLFGDDDDNFGPRAGFAWDVNGSGDTIVKGSAGIFYDRNALIAAATVPEKGGIFSRNAFDVALPRLGFEYTDSLIDLVITTGFPGGSPENPAYKPFADALRANPFFLYELFGIAVPDPSAPPVISADNIQQLSGLTPDEAIAMLEALWPGTSWAFFDVPGGSILGDRVLSFLPRGGLDISRDLSVYSMDRTPRTEAFTLGVDHSFANGLILSAAYVHRETTDLLTRRITNLFDVPPGDPNFGRTTDGGQRRSTVTYDGFIDYDGFVISLRRPFRGRYGYAVSYTYSDATDNLLTGGVGSGFSNNNHPEMDVGESNLSAPNVWVGSITTALPFDFRVSGSVFWRDGNAFSPRGITDQDGDGLVDQRDVSVPRNSFRVSDYLSVDARLEKAFRLNNDHEITLLIDVFNITNEDNVANVNSVSGPEFGTPNDFLPGREVQVGVRYFFGGR